MVPAPVESGPPATVDMTFAEVRAKIYEQVTLFAESLLVQDNRRETEAQLFIQDRLHVEWLRAIAKIASRDIEFLCFPVSDWATGYLHRELIQIKATRVDSSTNSWLRDRSTQVTGEERALRIVDQIIRSETLSHAFESTSRKMVPKHQKQHDHSIFRQMANDFVPPRPTKEAIDATRSNHPVAGAARRVGVAAMRDYLQNAGFRSYDPSKSGAARDKKAAGRRPVRCVKDLQHANPDDVFEPDMVLTLVDQDMYMDDFSPYAGSNMVIVTPEYTKLAGHGTDSVWYYTLNANQEVVVTERVSGANGQTCHDQRPWNYTANDFIHVEHPGKIAFTTYNVSIQYQAGSHHKWVWLARNSTIKLSKAVCDMMLKVVQSKPLDSVPLKKADNVVVVRGGEKPPQRKPLTARWEAADDCPGLVDSNGEVFLCGLFGDSTEPKYSIKYAYDMGPETSVELTENHYKVFNLMGKNRPKGYGVSEVKRTCQYLMIWRPGGLEPIYVSFFCIPIDYRPRPNILYTRQDGPPDEDPEEGNATEAAPNAFGDGPGVADTKSDAAHDAYRTKRLEKYANKKQPPAALKEVLDMLHLHFIEQVSGETGINQGSVCLCEAQVIYENRREALQAARLQRHVELLARSGIPKTNLKHEVGPKASAAPRGITQMDEERAIQTGRVGLLIKELLKHCSWYIPGNSPTDIAVAIRHITMIAVESSSVEEGGPISGLHDTDYTKMDETISEYIYNSLFKKFVLAFVHESNHDEVKKILEDNVDLTSMLNGDLMNTGFKNNSGSGVTTELNTMVSAFIEYVSTCFAITKYVHRVRPIVKGDGRKEGELDLSTVKKNTIRVALRYYLKNILSDHTGVGVLMWGSFMFGEDGGVNIWSIPYSVIGPCFGDDGNAGHLPMITDDDWGSSATFVTKSIGMILKVTFSRPEKGTFFLGRWYPRPLESLASYADVGKACRKLSVARNLDVEKYKYKLHGYWTTDSLTPGIMHYLTAVARIYGVELHRYEGVVETDEEGRPVLSKEMAYLLMHDKDMFYRVAGGPYCVEEEDVPMMQEAITEQIGFENSSECEAWLKAMSECTTWEQLDEFLIPGGDFDPDAEPEGTVRMSGPAVNLLAAQTSFEQRTLSGLPPQVKPSMVKISLGEVAACAESAVTEYLEANSDAGWVIGGEDSDALGLASSA